MTSSSSPGRNAVHPEHIPRRGWWQIIKRVANKLVEQNASILSAGVAFYATLALFPALGAIVTLYALIADPAAVQQHFQSFAPLLPTDVASIINEQLTDLVSRDTPAMSVGAVSGLLLAIWSAHRGIDALTRAITVAYEERETRGFVAFAVQTYLLTVAAIVIVVFALLVLVVLPAIVSYLPLGPLATRVATWSSWALFVGLAIVSVALLYRLAPPRRPPRWRWLTWGSVLATTLWIAGSAGFSFYVSRFASYNETYGALGAIVVLLLWFYLTSYSIVLGAAFNAEAEHQTAQDTTVGGNQPMGRRGAYVADTLPETNEASEEESREPGPFAVSRDTEDG